MQQKIKVLSLFIIIALFAVIIFLSLMAVNLKNNEVILDEKNYNIVNENDHASYKEEDINTQPKIEEDYLDDSVFESIEDSKSKMAIKISGEDKILIIDTTTGMHKGIVEAIKDDSLVALFNEEQEPLEAEIGIDDKTFFGKILNTNNGISTLEPIKKEDVKQGSIVMVFLNDSLKYYNSFPREERHFIASSIFVSDY